MQLSGLLEVFDELPAFGQVRAALDSAEIRSLHLPASARAPILAKFFLTRQTPTLFLVGRVDAVPIWQQLLEAWLPPTYAVWRFPEPTPLPYDRAPWSHNSRLGRLAVLTELMAGQHPLLPARATPSLIVTSVRALLQKTLPKRRFMTALRVLRIGQLLELDKTLQAWEEIGYERVSVVEGAGQFSQRGGIIDIFPIAAPNPVRLELFGNEIDTMRYFDPATQRSVAGELTAVTIPPAREALPVDAIPLGRQWQTSLVTREEEEWPAWQDDVVDLARGAPTPYLEYYLPLLYPQPASLLNYLPENRLVVVDDWGDLTQSVRDLMGHAAGVAGDQPNLPPGYRSPLFEWETLAARLTERQMMVLGRLGNEDRPPVELAPDQAPELMDVLQPGSRHGGQVRPFINELQRAHDLGERAVVVSRQAERLAELWRRAGRDGLNGPLPAPVDTVAQLPPPGSLTFVQGSLPEGFNVEGDEGQPMLLRLLTDAEVFGWNRPTPQRRRAPRALAPERFFADIAPGDYVVHVEYGIGRFVGLVVRSIGGSDREYLQLAYANQDMLYIPVHHADRLSKWLGVDDRPPTLHRVGDKAWRAAKASAQRAVREMADELLTLYAAREAQAGHAFSADTEWQHELEASFPYQETDDQLRAIQEVKADMEKPRPMDRLICGDVGYGKTEVALRAAFKAVMDGRQVAVLVPTTVLAQQHYATFSERLRPFPVTVELLSRFRAPRQQVETLHRLRDGQVDIIIGTHRLLSDDVSFKDLGLVIIDEEQRFGVGHKERLKQLRTEVDVLTMTATPIPRTLYMGLSGLRDISLIETPPAERLPVQTYVGPSDEKLIRRALMRELDRGGQVFFVHNHIQTIDASLAYLHRLAPEARIAIGHGQMEERKLEEVMNRFVLGELDILLSTTIIESGLDIPNANTLIVDRAELFGLSQLYQLRGRVGRSNRRAYAYFFHSPWGQITPEARARLEAIDENTQLGAGYALAMRDLEIRGAGELLGANQSGHIASLGFDLYTRLLARAVKAARAAQRGEALGLDLPDVVLIDLPLATYIPVDYIPDTSLRLRLYRRMAGLETLREIDEIAAELADRFGPIPDPVDNLLYQLRIKVLAAQAGVTTITTENHQIHLRLNMEGLDRHVLQRRLGVAVRVSRNGVWLLTESGTHAWQVQLVQALEKLAALHKEG